MTHICSSARFVLLLVALGLLASCAPQKTIYSAPGQTTPGGLPGHQAENPQKALEKYTRHLANTYPGDAGRSEAWRHTVTSAVQLGEYALAEKNLQAWKAENTAAATSWDWNQANAYLVLARRGKDAYGSYLLELVRRNDLDWTTREAAGMELVDHFWAARKYPLALDVFSVMHDTAPDANAKSALETHALGRTDALPQDELQRMLDSTLGVDPVSFPWSMAVWSLGMKRLENDPETWSAIWPSLSSIVHAGGLANQEFFAANLRALEQRLGVALKSQVLLLPLSGPYSSVGWQIARGADCAWRENRTQTLAPKIKLINTESPTFLNELKELCSKGDFPIIGGPLRKDVWGRIRQAGLQHFARFITFLPTIDYEGQEGWRFQSSAEDQARALLNAATSLGAQSCAILHPQDRFGETMTHIFQNTAASRGVSIAKIRPYDMDNPPGWSKAVADLLDTATSAKDRLNPEPPFQAVFMPDSLSRIQQLAPFFYYYEETRLLFLGPQIWSQGIENAHLEMQYFGLALFPGAWNPQADNHAVTNLRKAMQESGAGEPDLWAALGYDFVRFAQLLGASAQESPEAMNTALEHAASRMAWSLAPLRWTEGKASQDMFLFQPTATGRILADMTALRASLEQRQARREIRRQQLQENQ